ncbi:hypothetical protein [Ketobacter sp.]|uniref:hypothetical protein n=1 Tax=Ketobacter sp. TaxID=2083498 RepID=UPI000F1FD7A2|nr:hypothetical protein [Ketobacter sp.]RLT92811.1 MAG: hypothetical protein D9N14_20165 [Ketobacter sp.]
MPTTIELATLTRILTLAYCLGLTACASLSIPKQPSTDYIAELLQQHQFDSALQAIDQWQANDPANLDLPQQRKHITQAISQFESDALHKVQQLEASGQWQDAKQEYELALDTLPASQSLQNAYSEFSVRWVKYVNGLKEDLDVAQAKHWLNISGEIKALYHAAPNDQDARRWQLSSDSEREKLAQRLIDYGLAHEDNQHFGTAALRYDLAYRLAPGELTKPYHDRAANTLAQRKAKQKKIAKQDQQRQQSKLSELLAEFDQYLAEAEFQLAKQTLSAMEVIDANAPEVSARKAQWQQQRNIALEQAILEGKKFYTQGEFESAISVWTGALQLDPENKELKENIQRAEKFRENLKRLKQGS